MNSRKCASNFFSFFLFRYLSLWFDVRLVRIKMTHHSCFFTFKKK